MERGYAMHLDLKIGAAIVVRFDHGIEIWRDLGLAEDETATIRGSHMFVSRQFAVQSVSAGPYVGSDHRPIIMDIALVNPSAPAASQTSESLK
ncbi:MAG: hypothetical protein MUO41_03620 [Methyloceanibacter sp.]|nr:hypothetical protein [Methyloceanibacter sp.]